MAGEAAWANRVMGKTAESEALDIVRLIGG
jgi:hypothetical protein